MEQINDPKLGSAADVKANLTANLDADLKAKLAAAEAAATAKELEKPAAPKEKKISVTELIRNLIAKADYLGAGPKAQLEAEIAALLDKTTDTKPTVRTELRKLLFDAPFTGISKRDIYRALKAKFEEAEDKDPAAFGNKIYMDLQPAAVKLNGWSVKQLDGGNYVWVK